jgi:hypothetical protein
MIHNGRVLILPLTRPKAGPDPPTLTPAEAEARRRAIFAMLVRVQDAGIPVGTSRGRVAEAFRTTYSAVCQVEREGLGKEWPPL